MSTENPYKKEREQLFASLLKQAQRKGFIQSSTILKRFEKYHLSDAEKEELLFAYENEGVNLVYSNEDSPVNADSDDPEFNTKEFVIPESTETITSAVYSDPVKIYLKQIHEFPSLTHKETLALIRRIMEGDQEAREHLINCNLKFAFVIAAKYSRTDIPLLDLVQQANIGLMNAVDKYNPNRGAKFTSYAVFWIRQSIYWYIVDHSRLVRLPGFINTELAKIKHFQDDYCKEKMQYPTDDEIATALGYSIARVKYLKSLEYSVISTDDKPNDDMDGTYLDLLKIEDETQDPFNEIKNEDLEKALGSFLEKLPEREYIILKMRFGMYNGRQMSLEEVSTEMNLSRERIRQLESQALGRLRRMPDITSLYDYLR